MSLRIVVLGLTLSSSWGNGHATTYRALLRAMAARGHDILFLERDMPWYAAHRDLVQADYCCLQFYRDLGSLEEWKVMIAEADVVLVGTYVPDGAAVIDRVAVWASGTRAFYDIDTPVTLEALDAGDWAHLRPDQIPLFDVYFSFTGGPTLHALERDWGARKARVLHCSVDPEVYRNTSAETRWDLGYLGTYSADRQAALELLLLRPARAMPERRFVVAGSNFPPDLAWPSNVDRIEHLPPGTHADFYSSLGWTLNLTRSAMRRAGHSPSVRLFEAASCGTPIVTDAWPGLDEILRPNAECIVVHDAADIVRLLSTPDQARVQIGQAGRDRILARHTAAHRAAELEYWLSEAAAVCAPAGALASC